jgi:uncharacterized repeat protein (TIGR01451 family)
MEQRVGTAVRIAVLLGALLTSLAASSQPVIIVDYALQVLESGTPYPGGEVGYALVINANWSTIDQEPFVVELTVPQGLEPVSQCHGGDGEMQFDRATRVVTWTHRLEGTAFGSCPIIFRVDPLVPPGTTFTLTAKLTPPKSDPNASNDSASITSLVLAASDLEARSSADRRRVKPGETITYMLEVTNHGPQAAHDVIVTDELSPLVTFVSLEQTGGPPATIEGPPGTGEQRLPRAFLSMLPAGSTATFRLVVAVKTTFEAADIRNRLLADTPASVDVAPRNNVADEVVFAGPHADLTITTVVTGTSATRSTLLLRVANEGPEVVNGITVEGVLATAAGRYDFVDLVRYASVTPSQGTCTTALRPVLGGHPPLPEAWTLACQVGVLAPGAAATIAIALEGSPEAGPFRHFAGVGPAQNDPRPENNKTALSFAASRRRAARH